MEKYAKRLKSLREEEGLSIRELSAKTNINKDKLNRCERGVSQPNLKEIIILAEFYGVSTDYICGLKD